MNLIQNQWINVLHQDQSISKISPCEITAGNDGAPPIIDLITDRPDFKGALNQLLIGLLQTIQAPKTEAEWTAKWQDPPTPDQLEVCLAPLVPAFEFTANGPAFMQDYDLPEGEVKPISALLIDAPGGKTLRDNLDHFTKRDRVNSVCHACAALALFTLQTNAPPGGVGHRTGLRGGGPLTTLLLPDEGMQAGGQPTISLWHKLWLNVLPEKEARKALSKTGWDRSDQAHRFPWLGPTRTSEKKTGTQTQPGDVHPYQMYWGMPRRIRIDFSNTSAGSCDLCGTPSDTLIRQFITKNYGTDYTGTWEHPLTPHARRKLAEAPLPLHGQKGGVSYRHWLGLTLGDPDRHQLPAAIVNHYLSARAFRVSGDRQARLWAFGYDMDNMKARCWYDAVMPLMDVEYEKRDGLKQLVVDCVDAAVEVGGNLRQEVKKARYKRPQDVRGDWSFIDTEFWQATEPIFFNTIKSALEVMEQADAIELVKTKWHAALRQAAMNLFDRHALTGPPEDMALKRIVTARRNLSIWLHSGKKVKKLLGKRKAGKVKGRK
jgi:CRISPR system Cascade subunit CasA